MTISKKILIRLSPTLQMRIIDRLFKTGRAFEHPAFRMLLRAFQFCGLDLAAFKQHVMDGANKKMPIAEIARKMGAEYTAVAQDYEDKQEWQKAKQAYQVAVQSYLYADWLAATVEESELNYRLLIPCHDRIRELRFPFVEKISLPCYIGNIYANLCLPDPNRFSPPYPVILMVQGNDEVKEMNEPFEMMALERGHAVFDLDPPGWGESFLSGNHFKNLEIYRQAIKDSIDYLETREELDTTRIATFGVSFGGILTHAAAGMDSRIKASAGLGGPMVDTRKMREGLPEIQKRRTYRLSGANDEDELEQWTNQFNIQKLLAFVHTPALIIHGAEDELVPTDNAHQIAAAISGNTTVKIIPGGDHMCTNVLGTQVGPMMFDWLHDQLVLIV